jgi:hypothetical protein
MAKIFRTEELSVNGDNIRISAESGNLIFKDGSGNLVTSTDIRTQEISSLAFKDIDVDSDVSSLKTEISTSIADSSANLDSDISSLQAQRSDDESTNDSDISSLQAQRVADEATKDSDISSLQAQRVADEATNDSDISSLQAQRVADEATNDSDISSLQAQRVADEATTDSDVSSLHALAVQNDVVSNSVTINDPMTGGSYDAANARVTVSFGRTFASVPSVVGVMSAAVDSPIVGLQLTSVSTTGATFQLSDDVAVDGTYTIEVLASI